jgi:NTE family protein
MLNFGSCFVKIFRYIVVCLCAGVLLSCSLLHRETPPEPPPKQAKIAVVLGAGAARGFAHIGVLKILETHRVPIHMVVGTSAGAFVGSLYAYGLSPYELQSIALGIQRDDVADYTIPDNGFIKGEKLENYVNNRVKFTPLDKLKIPFYAVATNIQTGEEMVFGRGNTGRAVRASSAVPGVFNPVTIGESMYVDGGVVSPVAVDAARRLGADVVIAVDISSGVTPAAPSGTLETVMQSVDIMHNKMSVIQLKGADIVIRPKVAHIGSGDFTKRNEAIMEGEKAAAAAMPAINEILDAMRRDGKLP